MLRRACIQYARWYWRWVCDTALGNNQPINQPTYVPTYQPTYLRTHLPVPTYLPTYLRTYQPTFLPASLCRDYNLNSTLTISLANRLQAEGKHSTPVELSPGLLAGLSFLITNCILLIGFGVSLRPWSPRWHYRNTLHATYRAKR
jgi:hypothetical protein